MPLPALEVHEFLQADVGAEPSLGEDVAALAHHGPLDLIGDDGAVPLAMLANGPACTNTGVPSSVCISVGLMASFMSRERARDRGRRR